MTSHQVSTESQLRELYGFAKGRAVDKELQFLEPHSVRFIQLSPFALISTMGKSGRLDCSPRGGAPGFVQVLDSGQLMIADSRGNNRLDSLVNIVETGRIACLFMIPGIDETLRVNGRAVISVDPLHLQQTNTDKNPAKSVIIIEIEELYLHCAKAMMRSKLWSVDTQVERNILPSMGAMINDQAGAPDGVTETQEQMLKRYQQQL